MKIIKKIIGGNFSDDSSQDRIDEKSIKKTNRKKDSKHTTPSNRAKESKNSSISKNIQKKEKTNKEKKLDKPLDKESKNKEVVKEIMETYTHSSNFYKGSAKIKSKTKGFSTPKKTQKLESKKILENEDTHIKEMVVNIDEEVNEDSQEDEKDSKDFDKEILQGKFESGHKPHKIVKSLFIEGKVLFEIEWERSENKINPLNTMITEENLRKQIEPKIFTKLMNDHLNQD